MVRFDRATGDSQTFDCDAVVGEVVFAPRTGATEELDGYYLAFASSLAADRSARFLVWDAVDIPKAPIAEVAIPPTGCTATGLPPIEKARLQRLR